MGVDVSVYAAAPPTDTRKRFADQLAAADKTLHAEPDDANALYQAGQAKYRLGQDREALEELDLAVKKTTNPSFTGGYQYRAYVHARLGDAELRGTTWRCFLSAARPPG